MNWYVLYTKSRLEKTIAEKLHLNGIETYCPLLRTRRRWSDRWKWVEEPLFKSYVFVYLNDEQRDRVFGISGVVRYLYHCGKPAIVRDKEIAILKDWLAEYAHDSIDALGFHASDKVILRSGALADQPAEVVSSSGNYLSVKLETLGIRIRVDLRKNVVEKLACS